MKRRRKIALISLSIVLVAVAIGILLLAAGEAPEPGVSDQETSENEHQNIEVPKDLFVVPEAPLGTVAIVSAMLLGLLIARRKSTKTKKL